MRADELPVVVVAQAGRELDPVVDVEIGLAEETIGFQPEVAPSQVTPTHRSPMPRMVKLELLKLVFVKVTLGSVCRSATGLTICCFSRLSAVNALTAIGTSCNRCYWRCAVTTTSSP